MVCGGNALTRSDHDRAHAESAATVRRPAEVPVHSAR